MYKKAIANYNGSRQEMPSTDFLYPDAYQALTPGATVTWNYSVKGQKVTLAINQNSTLAISNLVTGAFGTLIVYQDATTPYTLTAPAGGNVTGDFDIDQALGSVTMLTFTYDGTTILWAIPPIPNRVDFGTLLGAPSAQVDNYSPTGWATGNNMRHDLNPAATHLFTGLAGGVEGRIATFFNRATDYLVIFVGEGSNSTAANRFKLIEPFFLMPGEQITFLYSEQVDRWIPFNAKSMSFAAQLDYWNDYMEGRGSATSGAPAITLGSGAVDNTATYGNNTTEKALGIITLSTSTSTTGNAFVGSPINNIIVPGQGVALYLCRVAVPTLSDGTQTYKIYAGFHDAINAANPTDGVYWMYHSPTSTSWRIGATANGSQTTAAASGTATADTTYVWLGIFLNAAWTRADYFYSFNSVDWVLAGSNSTNMPSNTQLVAWGAGIYKTAGSTARLLHIDAQGWSYNHIRG